MNRAEMISCVDDLSEAVKDNDDISIFVPTQSELTKEQIMDHEYELLGYFLTAHPLDDFQLRLEELVRIDDLEMIGGSSIGEDDLSTGFCRFKEGDMIHLGGLITDYKPIVTKKGQEMCFLELDDQTGTIEIVIFPYIYKAIKEHLGFKKTIEIKGKLEYQEKEVNGELMFTPKLLASKCAPMVKTKKYSEIELLMSDRCDMMAIKNALLKNPGTVPVVLDYHGTKMVTGYSVKQSPDIINELQRYCIVEGKTC